MNALSKQFLRDIAHYFTKPGVGDDMAEGEREKLEAWGDIVKIVDTKTRDGRVAQRQYFHANGRYSTIGAHRLGWDQLDPLPSGLFDDKTFTYEVEITTSPRLNAVSKKLAVA